jgi:hypothetical protein
MSQGGAEICQNCGKRVYPQERVPLKTKILHKQCLKCETCGLTLNVQTYKTFQGKVLCKNHYAEEDAKTQVLTTFYADISITKDDTDKKKDTKGGQTAKKKDDKKDKKNAKDEKPVVKKDEKKDDKKQDVKVEDKKEEKKEDVKVVEQKIEKKEDIVVEQRIEKKEEMKEEKKNQSQVTPGVSSGYLPINSVEENLEQSNSSQPAPPPSNSNPMPPLEKVESFQSMAAIPFTEAISKHGLQFHEVIPSEQEQAQVGWHARISRNDAHDKLKSQPQGTFLIRWSDNTNSFVLSYRNSAAPGGVENTAFIFPAQGGGINVKRDDESVIPFASLLEYVRYMQLKGYITNPTDTNVYGFTKQ